MASRTQYIAEAGGLFATCPAPSTLVEMLEDRAARQGDRLAYLFLEEGHKEAARITYAELDRRAQAIAGRLQTLRLEGQRALLIHKAGLDFVADFFGCLYAGVIPIPFPAANPAQPDRALPKLRAIVADAAPRIVLTVPRLVEQLQPVSASLADMRDVSWLTACEPSLEPASRWRPPELHREMLAYLQYTSGSTSRPKGVMVTHSNVISSLLDMNETWPFTEESVMVSWLPHYHDLGLVYGILLPLFNAIPAYLMAPVAFVQRPIRWLQAISKYKATHSAAPNFAYDLCNRRVTAEQLANLELRSWRVTVDGAEPVRKETMDRFVETFEPCGFHPRTFCPAYGLAEATLKVCTSLPDEVPGYLAVRSEDLKMDRIIPATPDSKGVQTIVSCGRPVLNTEIVIVRPDSLRECGDNQVGEIWIGGPLVAGGYWNRAIETQNTFKAFTTSGRGPFLRTGDLGFIGNGEVFVTGRLKELIIIAGRNHYPQDIELTVESSHEAVKPGGCAAFSVDVDGEERLAIAVEIDRRYKGADRDDSQPLSLHADSIVGAIRRAVSYCHEIDVHHVLLLKNGGVPKTSSGKTQRRACRDSFLEGRLVRWDGA